MTTGGKQRLDYFVAEDRQGGHGPKTFWCRLIVSAVSDFADEVLAAQLPQVICRLSRRVWFCRWAVQCGNFPCEIEAVNPLGEVERATTACITVRIRCLLKSIPPTLVF